VCSNYGEENSFLSTIRVIHPAVVVRQDRAATSNQIMPTAQHVLVGDHVGKKHTEVWSQHALHAILLNRESSNESTGSASGLSTHSCSRKNADEEEFWGTLLVSETHAPDLKDEHEHDQSARCRPEDDYGVVLCLPGFGRVKEVISPRATRTWSRVQSVKGEFVRKASSALSYSKELLRTQRDLACTKVTAAFRPKSADEIDQEQLMKLFEHAIKVGSVVVVSGHEEVTW